jgi:sugar lactone lactonase YvrE
MKDRLLSDPEFEFDYAFHGLSRPECIICTAKAGTFISHNPVGVIHIGPDGKRSLYGHRDLVKSDQFTPNGIALAQDGRLLIANTGMEGGLWQVTRDNKLLPLVNEVDGQHLYPANFVLADSQGRFWLSVSTRQIPRSAAYLAGVSDGYIVLIDNHGARIVADGLGYTNECRLSNDETYLYVNETFARAVSRFKVKGDGSLGPREIFCEFSHGDFPDGGVFDSENNYWVTSVVSNRIYRVEQDGNPKKLFEDADADYVTRAEEAYQTGCLSSEILYSDSGNRVNHLASISFGDADLRTAYLGTLKMDRLPSFRTEVAGQRPVHWEWSF